MQEFGCPHICVVMHALFILFWNQLFHFCFIFFPMETNQMSNICNDYVSAKNGTIII
jgi:hypothetical protein